MKAFPAMLKYLVLDYYYSNISISATIMNFDQFDDFIKNYFEVVEYKQNIFFKWKELILKSVISKNEGKLMEECFKKLIDKL